MTEIKPTEGDYLKSWLLFFLCGTIAGGVFGLIGGALFGGIAGAVAAASGHASDVQTWGQQVGRIGGFVFGIPVSYFCYRFTVKRLITRLVSSSSPQS
jgi:hypothetical protein